MQEWKAMAQGWDKNDPNRAGGAVQADDAQLGVRKGFCSTSQRVIRKDIHLGIEKDQS